MLKKVKHIIIFGGGTSGWLTAAYLLNNLKFNTKITIIEDLAKGPIGVGEGTQPYTSVFLAECGLKPKDWMKECDASFKYGVELINWTDSDYFVDNDRLENSLIADELYTSHYFAGKDPKEFSEWLPPYKLARENLSPKFEGFDQNFAVDEKNYGAFHFNAFKILDALKKKCGDKVNHIDTTIVDVEYNGQEILSLIDKDNKKYSADLFVDCTGFSSILLGKTFKEEFVSYNDFLLCDKAVAMPTQYKDPYKECHPYTKATTMTAGWRWTIPTYSRIGNGYVYSSKHITPDQAEQELRDVLGEYDAQARHLDIKSGKYKNISKNNVVAVGLSAGFIEPLEATGITFTTSIAQTLTSALNLEGNILTQKLHNYINDHFEILTEEIFAFVWAHYHFSTRNDTKFWKEIRNQNPDNLPAITKAFISNFFPKPPKEYRLTQFSMFSTVQWFSMINASGLYKEEILTDAEKKYCEYFLDMQNSRVESAKKLFDNHYNYLREQYNEDTV